jgi:photoactive yellow protein
MRDQLEALYEEKEALLRIGIDDARTAAGRIDELEARLSTLREQHEDCRGRMEALQDELGTTDVDQIVEMIDAAPSAAATEAATSDSPEVLPRETVTALDEQPEAALDDLSVGVLRLDDDGAIDYLNEAALALPGLDAAATRSELLGEMFFRVVPSASNTLFLDRFRTGVDREQMDAQFSYTFVSPPHPPTAFHVHLYRSGPAGANWILVRPAR